MRKYVFIGLIVVLFLYVSLPFLFAVLMGAVFSIILFPWVDRMNHRGVPSVVSSGILTCGVTVLVLLPVSFLIFFFVKSAFQELLVWKQVVHVDQGFLDGFIQLPIVNRFMVSITSYFPLTMNELKEALRDFSSILGSTLTDFLRDSLTQLPNKVISLAVVVASLYFFLLDGPKLVQFIRRHSFFSPRQTQQFITALSSMCRSVLLASVVSGGVQALLAMLAGAIVGVPHVVLLGALVFMTSFMPFVGSLPITVGLTVQQLAANHDSSGLFLGLVTLLIICVDNLIRPFFLKATDGVNLHPLLGFISALGGLQTFGFTGVFLGPILGALCVVSIKILVENSERKGLPS